MLVKLDALTDKIISATGWYITGLDSWLLVFVFGARPLPPPLGSDEQHKDEWAHQLEITRGELDEMSPSDFGKAWDKRNERLKDGGVFEHLADLTEAHGWDVIEKMTASELIRAVADLGLTPSAANSEPADARR